MEKKVVLITGCGSGLGKALAEEFHGKGFSVTATDKDALSLDELEALGMTTEQLDVTDSDGIGRVVDAMLEKEGRIDILINNAGYGLIGPAVELPEGEISAQLRTNFIGPLLLIQKVAPSMRENRGGIVINIGSVSGVVTTPFAGAYCASKAALHALSDALRMELAPFGIRVMTVQPGGIRSNFGKAAGALVSRILKPDSWYRPVADSIRRRAQYAQSNPTPAEAMAKKLVALISAGKTPPVLRIGKGSTKLPLLKRFLPVRVFDRIQRKKFNLTNIPGN